MATCDIEINVGGGVGVSDGDGGSGVSVMTVIYYIVIRRFFLLFFFFYTMPGETRPTGGRVERKLWEKGDRESDTDFWRHATVGAGKGCLLVRFFFPLRHPFGGIGRNVYR